MATVFAANNTLQASMRPRTLRLVIKPLVFVLCLLPFAWLVYGAINDMLGANPVETMTRDTGEWALRFLLVTLTITPLRKLTGKSWLMRLRRMLGLYAFFYALLHFTTYIWLDQFFDWAEILKDIVKRPFITVGFAAFVLLMPLAFTSTNKMMKRLGKKWKQLHKLVYVIAALGILHFLWIVKADTREPAIYFTIFLLLMVFRAYDQRKLAANKP